jgi:hypothetical protein
MRAFIAILISLFIIGHSFQIQSAENISEHDIGISLGLGIDLGVDEKGHFYPAPSTTTKTTVAYGFGLHYRSISLFYATRLNISIEAYYHAHATDPVSLYYQNATSKYSGYSVPLMIWAELMPKSKFGPLVRIGMGAIWTDWKDECSDNRLYSPNHRYWSFSYGMGGGIYYSPNHKYDIILIVQSTICTEDDLVSDDYWGDHKLDASWSLEYWGVIIRHWF